MNALEILTALKKCKVVPRLEGGQLKLSGEVRHLSEELLQQVKAGKEELCALLSGSMNPTRFSPIPALPEQPSYRASNAQKRIWVLGQFEGAASAYTIVRSFYLKGAVIRENLDRAFQACIRRHESLRTVFQEIAGELRQVVLPAIGFSIEFEDISHLADSKSYLLLQQERSLRWVFDLEKGPLLRVKLLRISPDEHAMTFGVHHIISDGWSMAILVQEVLQQYEAYCRKEDLPVAPLRMQYKDYVEWMAGKLEDAGGKKAKEFWKAQFATEADPLHLPVSRPRQGQRSFEGAVLKFYPGQELYTQVIEFGRRHQVTAFNFFRATLHLLLYKLSGQEDITIGIPVSGRNHFDLETQIGLYVNTLPLRITVDTDQDFLHFLRTVSEHSFQAFEFQDYPFDLIIENLAIPRDTARNPLFDVMLVLQNTATGDGHGMQRQYGFELSFLDKFLGLEGDQKLASKFDLTFNLDHETDNTFFIEIEYDARLFDKHRIDQLYSIFLYIIRQVLDHPAITIPAISITGPEERQRIMEEFNRPIEGIGEYSILHLLEGAFRNYAEETALLCGDRALTYRELDSLADRIASQLAGLLPETPSPVVGLLMERSEWVIACILGILRCEAAYVPIETHYPSSRIGYIITDAQPVLLIVDDKGASLIPPGFSGRVLPVEEISRYPATPTKVWHPERDLREQLAYLIYTSGSTGTPKGVKICHRNTIAFLKWAALEFADTPFQIAYATTSYCFDLSIFEFFFPLLMGRCIRMLGSALEIPAYLGVDRNVLLNTVPSVVNGLLGENIPWDRVMALNMAGEEVPQKLKQALPHTRMEVRNLYGPSEDTTYSTVYRFEQDGLPFVPIGRPVGYTHLYILDPFGNLVPPGVEGEICLSGQSVAMGYWERPELTRERFPDNPFFPGMRLYKTGDTGRWLNNGMVEFMGRKDDQVKIRGYRIEPGEIRHVLEQYPGIRQAVVIVRTMDSEKQLLAYFTSDEEIATPAILDHLESRLPAYMIPVHVLRIEAMPLNANGKLDRKRLPVPDVETREGRTFEPPRNSLQRSLLGLWKEVLLVEDLGITDNFFQAGGHSLKATRLRFLVSTRLKIDISLDEIFTLQTVEKQAKVLESRGNEAPVRIQPAGPAPWYPISFSQQRLWVLIKFEEASRAYNMPAAFVVKGELDTMILQRAFQSVITRYEILRTVFAEREDRPVQLILPPEEASFFITGIIDENIISPEEEIAWLQKRGQTVFDPAKGPLIDCLVLRTARRTILSFSMHHIISDGWSVVVLYQEVVRAYRELAAGRSPERQALSLQYKDFAVWQRNVWETATPTREELYWKELLAGELPVLELPVDHPRPDIKTYNGATYYLPLEATLSLHIEQLARVSDASVFMVLVAAVNLLLKKYTGQHDLVIGAPVAGRQQAELEDQIGCFVNTIPIRTVIDSDESFGQLIGRQKEIILKAFAHQDYPFELLPEILSLKRDLSRSPLFDVVIVLQNIEGLRADEMRDLAEGLWLDRLKMPAGTAKYDLCFTFSREPEGLLLELEYNTDLFEEATIARMAGHLKVLLQRVTGDPAIVIRNIDLSDEKENHILRMLADQTGIGFDRQATIVSLFRKAVAEYSDRIALTSEGRRITYRELDERSGKLAFVLRNKYKVRSQDLILLHTRRSEWMIIAILGVLKAGAAYVPVDPDYPSARIDYILADSKSRLVLYDQAPRAETPEKWPDITFSNLLTEEYTGSSDDVPVHPQDLAYVIYTSGTTGNPKGVLIEHGNVSRLLFNNAPLFDFNEEDVWSLFHSYCFDFSVWEMYGALLFGGTLVVVPKEVAQDGLAFFDLLREENITVLNQTPTAFRSLLQNNHHRLAETHLSVRYLIFGGEALMPEILRDWKEALPECRTINMYGITETTVHVTYKEITAQEIAENRSNIGIPIPTLCCYVLDRDLKQVPIGVIGELCVGGAGVARGYLNKPELTAEKYIQDPVKPGQRIYRSGDFARILPSGDIEYIGRRDEQVKIRGHRIETGEVEAVMTGMPEIQDAVVLPLLNDQKEFELAAYFIPAPGWNETGFRQKLESLLPAYMVPAYLLAVAAFPVNENGKLDKKALPAPVRSLTTTTDYMACRNETDSQLLTIWEAVLSREGIGIRDNFFDLGGNSLKATRVISRIHELFGIKIDFRNLFINPTIEHTSDYIETIRWMEERPEAVMTGGDELIF